MRRRAVCSAILAAMIAAGRLTAADPVEYDLSKLERSYWLHASLAPTAQKGYWGAEFPAVAGPTDDQINKAVKLLTGPYAASRLYLVYHNETSWSDAKRAFAAWRRYCPKDVEIVPALLLRMYDQEQSAVFTARELRLAALFLKRAVNERKAAVFDVYAARDQGNSLKHLEQRYSDGLIRLGVQPDEKLEPPFVAGVQDTWSGFCHGKSDADWLDKGFGAETLKRWVDARNKSEQPIVWDLIVVAWDYSVTERGAYPGYDDAGKNMPLPPERNSRAANLILRTARRESFAGFSSDLLILQANSEHPAHDGRQASFYETLKRGVIYDGYYGRPLQEIAGIYKRLAEGKTPDER